MTQSPLAYRGLYINMDRYPDRRAAMEAQFREGGMAAYYERVLGLEGAALAPSGALQPGELGCLASHVRALETGAASGAHFHIMEDDAVLCRNFLPAALSIVQSPLLDQYDMVFTETAVAPQLDVIRFFKRAYDRAMRSNGSGQVDFTVFDLKDRAMWCASSYFVAARAAPRIIACFEEAFRAGPKIAIDMFYRRFIDEGKIRAACILPFLSTIRLDAPTTTGGRVGHEGNPTVKAMELLRYSFFVDRDLANVAQPHLDAITNALGPDPHRDFLAALSGFLVSDQYKTF
ncbi:MAG: glycosyltransferase family 25 protein [Hyphomonadaceae bacterium]